jgi:hypothetical protein
VIPATLAPLLALLPSIGLAAALLRMSRLRPDAAAPAD